MATLVLLEGVVDPKRLGQLEEFFVKVLPDTRGFDGCQSLNCYLSTEERSLAIVQRWDSRAHYEKYLDWRKRTGVFSELEDLLTSPAKIRFFEQLDV